MSVPTVKYSYFGWPATECTAGFILYVSSLVVDTVQYVPLVPLQLVRGFFTHWKNEACEIKFLAQETRLCIFSLEGLIVSGILSPQFFSYNCEIMVERKLHLQRSPLISTCLRSPGKPFQLKQLDFVERDKIQMQCSHLPISTCVFIHDSKGTNALYITVWCISPSLSYTIKVGTHTYTTWHVTGT